MSTLQKDLEKLVLRLDRMGLRVVQTLQETLSALRRGDVEAGQAVETQDTAIDREEVEIEQECVRLLALYQPTAVDLRTIFFIIKVNNDLERMADKAVNIGRRIRHLVAEGIDLSEYPQFEPLAAAVDETVAHTLKAVSAGSADEARAAIRCDQGVDGTYKDFVRAVLDHERERAGGVDRAMTLVLLSRALERIGDLCSNIAEEAIFLRTGDIVRHAPVEKP